MREGGILIKKLKKNKQKQIEDGKRAWKQVNPEGEVFHVTILAHTFWFVNKNCRVEVRKGDFEGEAWNDRLGRGKKQVDLR
jgi:hypothetical protein